MRDTCEESAMTHKPVYIGFVSVMGRVCGRHARSRVCGLTNVYI